MEEGYKVKSLVKAVNVLECFSVQNPELGITEIATMLDTQKSTVHNILTTFQKLGYISQNPDNGKYSLGIKLLQFSYIINSHIGIRKFLFPYMRKLFEESGETTYMGIPRECEVIYIECLAANGMAASRSIQGEHAPMSCTAIGKAMLAYMPEMFNKACADLKKFTDTTITTPDALRENLALTRERGYSVDDMEHEYGIVCVGFPVFGLNGKVIAALSVSGPSLRFDSERLVKVGEMGKRILAEAQHLL